MSNAAMEDTLGFISTLTMINVKIFDLSRTQLLHLVLYFLSLK